jgi:hypothetical protein
VTVVHLPKLTIQAGIGPRSLAFRERISRFANGLPPWLAKQNRRFTQIAWQAQPHAPIFAGPD